MERFLNGTHCLRLSTLEDWEQFLDLAEDNGLLWFNGSQLRHRPSIGFPQTVCISPSGVYPFKIKRSLFNSTFDGLPVLCMQNLKFEEQAELMPMSLSELISVIT